MLLDEVGFDLKNKCLVDAQQTLLVAVSGGPDSLCLLDLLRRIGCRLAVAHLDHGLRPESKAEAEAVRQAAHALGVPFVLGQEDVPAFAETHGLSIEEAARTVRYVFLFHQAKRLQAQAVATGHTADDQVETVLMHLLRGAGLSGLGGMAYRSLPNTWSQEIPLVRPLLGVWREDILAYLATRGLQPAQDASNLDRRYYRNRLRHELIPYLDSYNPGVRQRLWRTAEALHQDYLLLDKLVEAAWGECVREEGVGYVALIPAFLRQQPNSLQRHLLRRAISRLRPGLRDIDYAAIQRALKFLETPARSAQVDLVAGLRLLLEGDRLWLAAWEADLPGQAWPRLDSAEECHLDVPGTISLPEGWTLEAEIFTDSQSRREQALANADPYQAWLDLDRLHLPLHIRSRRPGERFQPLGMGGHSVRLSDFMINARLPRRARSGWPLVCSAGQAAWIPGLRLAHPFRVAEATQQLVKLSLVKSAPGDLMP